MTLSTRHSPSYTETINFQLKTIESKTDSDYSVMMHASHRHHRRRRNHAIIHLPTYHLTTPYLISRRQQHRKLRPIFCETGWRRSGRERRLPAFPLSRSLEAYWLRQIDKQGGRQVHNDFDSVESLMKRWNFRLGVYTNATDFVRTSLIKILW